MKTPLTLLALAAGAQLSVPALAGVLTYDWTGSQVIPDNNPSGYTIPFSISTPAAAIQSVTVTLDIAGGYNGDLYGYLSHDAGGYAVLLNRVGFGSSTPGSSGDGYGDKGLSITLSDAAAANVHFYQNASPPYSGGALTGTWQPDGRTVLPNASPSAFDAPGSADFSSFTGINPDGNWTFFLADMSSLNTSTLKGVSVSITTVPEPTATLGAMGLLALAFVGYQRSVRG